MHNTGSYSNTFNVLPHKSREVADIHQPMVVFLTDGKATEGVTDTQDILANIERCYV